MTRTHRPFASLLALTVLLISGNSVANNIGSAFGALGAARTLGQGVGMFGVGAGIADATSFFGSFNYGLSSDVDGRLKFGLIDGDGGDTEITFGADFKWHFLDTRTSKSNPFDLAFGGLLEYVDFSGLSAFQVGAHATGSYPFALNRGGTLSPYTRLNVRLVSVSLDLPPGFSGDGSDSDLEFGANFGAEWAFSRDASLMAEFQLDGNDGLFLGFNFRIM